MVITNSPASLIKLSNVLMPINSGVHAGKSLVKT